MFRIIHCMFNIIVINLNLPYLYSIDIFDKSYFKPKNVMFKHVFHINHTYIYMIQQP